MNKVARAGSAISARAQLFPVSGVLLANLAWGIGPILTVAIDMSINSTIFYQGHHVADCVVLYCAK